MITRNFKCNRGILDGFPPSFREVDIEAPLRKMYSALSMSRASHKIAKEGGSAERPWQFYKCEKAGCARTYTTMARYAKHIQVHHGILAKEPGRVDLV